MQFQSFRYVYQNCFFHISKHLRIVLVQVKFKTYELTQTHHRLLVFFRPLARPPLC